MVEAFGGPKVVLFGGLKGGTLLWAPKCDPLMGLKVGYFVGSRFGPFRRPEDNLSWVEVYNYIYPKQARLSDLQIST